MCYYRFTGHIKSFNKTSKALFFVLCCVSSAANQGADHLDFLSASNFQTMWNQNGLFAVGDPIEFLFLLPVRRCTHTTRAMRHYVLPVLYEVPPLLTVAPWRGCFGERKYGVKRDVNTFKTWHFGPAEPKTVLQGNEKASSSKLSVRLYVSLRMFAFFVDGVRRVLSGGGRRVLDE